ncbi:MAG: CYTH domain-containing protein [Coriobacteriia bacterium]|nr:CYTH domain-containing protein [Coriobacteriia bacterium]
MEIERKFLVHSPGAPDFSGLPSRLLRQGYLAACGEEEVRVRSDGVSCWLTVKKGAGLERDEHEVPLSLEQFDALWPATAGARLEKRRYVLHLGAHTVEVDVYGGRLEGLIVAEVEFGSRAEADAFEPPEWFGTEITGRPEYTNASLAVRGLPSHEDDSA